MGWTTRNLAGRLGLTALILAASLAASPSSAETLSYTYDDLGRLESLTYEDGTQILYSYDAAGNRTAHIVTVNRAPAATGDTYGMVQDTVLTVAAPGVLGNDSDADGDVLSAVLVTGAISGTLALALVRAASEGD